MLELKTEECVNVVPAKSIRTVIRTGKLRGSQTNFRCSA